MKKTKVIEIKGLCIRYNNISILKDIDLDIEEGAFLAIIGPNGAGKSTLIKAILGLIKGYKGQIRIMGRPLNSFKEWDMIGYVPQKAAHIDRIFPITAYEVVELGLKRGIRGKDATKYINSALSKVGMEDYGCKKVYNMSGGEQQKIFIAKAIVNNPRILFLDEPTTGVDIKAQDAFYELLKGLNTDGMTIVMVTHDIAIVNKYVRQVACLNNTLIFHGSHDEFCSSKNAVELLMGDHHLIAHRH